MAKHKSGTNAKPAQKTKLIFKAKKPNSQKTNVSVNFKPHKSHELYKNFGDVALFPIFNKDRKYFTPTFVLRFIQNSQSDDQLRRFHEKKVIEYTTEIDSDKIMIPKPRSKNMYCAVCRQTYQDYYIHIHTQQHRQHSKTSRYMKYINDLCVIFNPHLKKEPKELIENELNELSQKYKISEDTNYWNVVNSLQTSINKSQKDKKLNTKKENSISYSTQHHKTTIILSSD